MNTPATAPVFKPLYEQIKDFLTQSLMAGEWKPGEVIPSEMELAARFNVSQGTVRKAIDAMAQEKILVRRQGKGTYVSSHQEMHSKLRFLRMTAASGEKEILDHQLLSCERRKSDAATSRLTGLKQGASIIAIQRLLTFSGRPVILDDIILEARHFRGLNATRINEHNGSLYSMYERVYGIPMVRASEKLSAEAATDAQAAALNIATGYPLLRIERTAFTYGDQPMEWRVGHCVTADHYYLNELD